MALPYTVESFVTEAWLSNLHEIQSAYIAVRRSQSAEVVPLAHRMIADNRLSQAVLKVELDRTVGQFPGFSPVGSTASNDDRPSPSSSEDTLDTTYLSQQKLSHKEAITLFEAFEQRRD